MYLCVLHAQQQQQQQPAPKYAWSSSKYCWNTSKGQWERREEEEWESLPRREEEELKKT